MATLVDTNVFIDYFRNVRQAVDFLEALPTKPFASVVTVVELVSGAKSRKDEAIIRGMSAWVTFLPVDPAIADRAGQFLKHYRASHGVDDMDALIAASAEHHGYKLATRNVKHFPMFARLRPAY